MRVTRQGAHLWRDRVKVLSPTKHLVVVQDVDMFSFFFFTRRACVCGQQTGHDSYVRCCIGLKGEPLSREKHCVCDDSNQQPSVTMARFFYTTVVSIGVAYEDTDGWLVFLFNIFFVFPRFECRNAKMIVERERRMACHVAACVGCRSKEPEPTSNAENGELDCAGTCSQIYTPGFAVVMDITSRSSRRPVHAR